MRVPRSVSDSVVIAADARTIYACISDPTQMGRWSGENVGATVLGDQSGGAYVGMEFQGHNKWNPALRGRVKVLPSWTTRCVVTAADAPSHFAFRAWIPILGNPSEPRLVMPLATWDYRLEPTDGGTRVTETWTHSMSDRIVQRTRFLQPLMTGGKPVGELQARNIAMTLARLKQDLEGQECR